MILAAMPYPPTTTAAILITFAVVVLAVGIATWLLDRHLKRDSQRREAERKATRERRVP